MSELKKAGIIKIIIIGESGVGKTAILDRYVNDSFNDNYKSTIGVDFLTKQIIINQQLITMQIWDTSGQERFNSLSNAFYRGADACILVYDITNNNTFNKINDWKNTFENIANITNNNDNDNDNSFPFLLLGNKIDLKNERKVRIYYYYNIYYNIIAIYYIVCINIYRLHWMKEENLQIIMI